jgi:hypothetical protein
MHAQWPARSASCKRTAARATVRRGRAPHALRAPCVVQRGLEPNLISLSVRTAYHAGWDTPPHRHAATAPHSAHKAAADKFFADDFISERRLGLEQYLSRLLGVPRMTSNPDLISFLELTPARVA